MNTSILKHENYKIILNEFLEDWVNTKQEFNDLQTWWDTAKMYIKMCLAFLLLPPPEHKPELMGLPIP